MSPGTPIVEKGAGDGPSNVPSFSQIMHAEEQLNTSLLEASKRPLTMIQVNTSDGVVELWADFVRLFACGLKFVSRSSDLPKSNVSCFPDFIQICLQSFKSLKTLLRKHTVVVVTVEGSSSQLIHQGQGSSQYWSCSSITCVGELLILYFNYGLDGGRSN